MITVEQGRMIMQPRIESQNRHEYYKRTVELRKFYHAIVTGEGLADHLTHFETRETKEDYQIRQKIIKQCITPAVNEACAKFFKTSRYPNIKKEMFYQTGPDRIDLLQEALEKFCYDGDVQSYLSLDFDLKSLIDPNSFLVIDFKDFDALQNERPDAYGVHIPCDQVVDFEYLPNDDLNWLIISKQVEFYNQKAEKIKVTDYIGYLGDDVLMYQQVHEDRKLEGGELIELGVNSYRLFELESLAGQVQAFRLGYRKDPITNYTTTVSPLENARTVVIDLNDDKSEYDQTKRFHVFPQKYQFVQPCPGESEMATCRAGKNPEGKKCKICGGKGVLIHMSSSDAILLPMPTEKDDYVMPLSEMSHYAKPDLDIIQHLREDVDAGKLSIIKAIFTTESAVKTDGLVSVNKTATEVDIKADDLNDVLVPYAKHKTRFYKFIVHGVAKINDLDDNLKVLFEYPASLRLETVEELQEKFSTLVTSGASPTLLDDIEADIAAKRFMDDPEGLKRYEFWQVHRPFRNRTSEDVQFAIGGGYSPKWIEVLWALYETIITELENEHKELYTMPYVKAHALIKERAQQYVSELEPVVPENSGFLQKTKTATQQAA